MQNIWVVIQFYISLQNDRKLDPDPLKKFSQN